MIGFRHADARFPFLWETTSQPGARWHHAGTGPVQYLAATPDGAWAELLRHEAITDPADLEGVRRSLWAIEVPAPPTAEPVLDLAVATGGVSSYPACQAEAERLRRAGEPGLVAPSAAVVDGPSGFRVEGGLRVGRDRRETVTVLFGVRPEVVGWAACAVGRPRSDLLPRVRPLG